MLKTLLQNKDFKPESLLFMKLISDMTSYKDIQLAMLKSAACKGHGWKKKA